MEYLRQTIRSNELSDIFKLPPTLLDKKIEVIILPAENDIEEKQKGNICKIGCCPNLPELPESFFDPLPEEELKSWGL